jgi:hypothetical protein
MQVVHAYANLYEEAPNAVFTEKLVLLFIQRVLSFPEEFVEIAVVTKLHHDVDLAAIGNERVIVLYDIWRVYLSHDFNFSQSVVAFAQLTGVDFFNDDNPLLPKFFSDLINFAITSLTKHSKLLVIFKFRSEVTLVRVRILVLIFFIVEEGRVERDRIVCQ